MIDLLAGSALAQRSSVSVWDAVYTASDRLASARTETPRLDAEVLMAFTLGWERAQLYAHWEVPLPRDAFDRYAQFVDRRAQGEPVAYIRNRKEFLGLDLYVDERVLIPRPETELLVDRAVAWLESHPHATVVDVGTGSGAIGIGILSQSSDAAVTGVDCSDGALEVAEMNARKHGTSLTLRLGSLLEPIEGKMDLVVGNLPYLTAAEIDGLQDTSVAFEPRQALDGGEDGLALFAHLFDQLPSKLAAGGCVLLEIGCDQVEALSLLAGEKLPGLRLSAHADYSGRPRILQLEA